VLDAVHDEEHAHEGCLHVDKVADRRRHGSQARRTTGTVTAAGAAALDQDGRQHPKAVAEGIQVAHPVDPGMLETWHFGDAKSFRRYPHMDQRLDLETVAPQPPVSPACRRRGDVEVQHGDVLLPEHVVSVAEV